MPSLSERDCQAELMDDPALGRAEHQMALKGLGRVNRFSRSPAIVWPAIRDLAQARSADNPLRILDVACGGGDVALAIARRAKRANLPIQIDGCDINSVAVEYSNETKSAELPKVDFFRLDALAEDLPSEYDVLMCSLFLHHLGVEDARSLLIRMADAARKLILVNDLRRTRIGYTLAYVGCRLLTRSPVVHHDGPMSVRAAFTSEEVRRLAREAGLENATISHHWPQRFLLSWRKPA